MTRRSTFVLLVVLVLGARSASAVRAPAQSETFPSWATLLIAFFVTTLVATAVLAWARRRKQALAEETLPQAKADARVDIDGLAHSAANARERFQRAGTKDGAAAVQRAWVDLDAVLDRVRHALPGGSVDRSRIRKLEVAVREAKRIASLVEDLRNACDRAETTDSGAESLADRLQSGAADLRALLDAYRRQMD